MTPPAAAPARPPCPHRHGTRFRYRARRCHAPCSCGPCRAAINRAARARAAARAAGPLRVPVAPVQAHIAALRAAGVGLPRIAARSAVTTRHLQAIAAGEVTMVLRDTAAAITAITPADALHVAAVGTARRLAALGAAGYTWADLQARLGWAPGAIRDLLGRYAAAPARARCGAARARAVAALYAELETVLPPRGPAAARARAAADRAGRAPREAWPPGTVDDPAARPWAAGPADPGTSDAAVMAERVLAGRWAGPPLRKPARQAVAGELWARGLTDGRIAELLRVNVRTVQRDWAATGTGPRCTAHPLATWGDQARWLRRAAGRAHDRYRNAKTAVARANAATSIADLRIAAELAAGADPASLHPVAGGRTKQAMREALAALNRAEGPAAAAPVRHWAA